MIDVSKMPKIELHCHLDGSIRPEIVQKLLAREGQEYTIEELERRMRVTDECTSLPEYLSKFELPVGSIQTLYGLETAAFDMAAGLARDNVKYVEVRFAPSLSTSRGLRYTEIIEAVEKGLARARAKADIMTGIIVCAMRHMSFEENAAMFIAARELLGAGVVACDLAGDESTHPVEEFKELFALAKSLELPATIHSGETGRAANIRGAIEYGAKRIGHGIAMSGDEALMKLCADKHIGVEMRPTSNIQTHAISDFSKYPLREFLDHGVLATINTDDMIVSDTSNTKEFELVRDTFKLSDDELKKIYMNSAEVVFASDEVKDRLIKMW